MKAVAMILLAVVAFPASAEFYVWRDEHGTRHVSTHRPECWQAGRLEVWREGCAVVQGPPSIAAPAVGASEAPVKPKAEDTPRRSIYEEIGEAAEQARFEDRRDALLDSLGPRPDKRSVSYQ